MTAISKMTGHSVQQTSRLLSLADELLLGIIDHIDSRHALINLALTCSKFRNLAESFIWRDLLILTGKHAQCVAAALDSREARILHVQDLSVRYKDPHKNGIEQLGHFIRYMDHLRSLTIESPCPNNTEWRSGVYFDSWTRIDYSRILEDSVRPFPGSDPALPALQTRKDIVSIMNGFHTNKYSQPSRTRSGG